MKFLHTIEDPRKVHWRSLGVIIGTILLCSAIPSLALNSKPALAEDGSESNSLTEVTAAASEAYSDFNGDGYDDLAIGVPLEDVGSTLDAGAVNVIYGSSSGLRTSASADGTGRSDQLWHQNTAGVEDNVEASDMFGSAVAPGNFNGDNFVDLAIGVPGESVGTASGAGAVQVLYGSSAGLRASSPPDQIWHQNSAGVDNSASQGDGFGSSLVAGDFNGDGKDDLAIGVPNENVAGLNDAGAVSILYGSSSGLRSSSPADQFWHQGKTGIDDVENSDDHFGSSVSSGDYNDDGYADLAIGVPGEDIETDDPDFGDLENTGGLHVIYGSSGGLQTAAPAADFWDGQPVGEPDEFEDTFWERAGFAVASGDFNSDGYDDLAVGVPGESSATPDSCIECGTVNILYGSESGLEGASSPDSQSWHQQMSGLGGFTGAHFGWSLAAGDFNSDGKDDLAIGTPDTAVPGNDNPGRGAVYILHGSSSGLQSSSPVAQLWHQDKTGVDNEREDGDLFGSSLSTGDFNNDGKTDLAVGVPGEGIGSAAGSGAVNVLYGSSSGLRTTSPADQFWHQGKPGVEDTEEDGDSFGSLSSKLSSSDL